MPTLALAEAEALVASALERNRTSRDNARVVAKALVLAEADGIPTHGLLRTGFYAAQARAGKPRSASRGNRRARDIHDDSTSKPRRNSRPASQWK